MKMKEKHHLARTLRRTFDVMTYYRPDRFIDEAAEDAYDSVIGAMQAARATLAQEIKLEEP